jgi:hypothetical protein
MLLGCSGVAKRTTPIAIPPAPRRALIWAELGFGTMGYWRLTTVACSPWYGPGISKSLSPHSVFWRLQPVLDCMSATDIKPRLAVKRADKAQSLSSKSPRFPRRLSQQLSASVQPSLRHDPPATPIASKICQTYGFSSSCRIHDSIRFGWFFPSDMLLYQDVGEGLAVLRGSALYQSYKTVCCVSTWAADTASSSKSPLEASRLQVAREPLVPHDRTAQAFATSFSSLFDTCGRPSERIYIPFDL